MRRPGILAEIDATGVSRDRDPLLLTARPAKRVLPQVKLHFDLALRRNEVALVARGDRYHLRTEALGDRVLRDGTVNVGIRHRNEFILWRERFPHIRGTVPLDAGIRAGARKRTVGLI